MVGKVSDRSFIYCFWGQSCGLAVIFQESCWTNSFPPWRNVLFALQCSWIHLFPCIPSDGYSWYPICSLPLSPYCETVIILLLSFSLGFVLVWFVCFLPREKQGKGQLLFGGGKKLHNFLIFLEVFIPFPSFLFFILTFLLTFSCVLSKGWACSSLLIYSFIFENKNADWLFFPLVVYLRAHTCFFHSGFLQVLARIFSCSAFCFSFLLCDYAGSPGPPSLLFRALSLGFASSCSAPTQDFAAWLSSRRCCGAAADTLFHSFFFGYPISPSTATFDLSAKICFASFYFGVSPFNN